MPEVTTTSPTTTSATSDTYSIRSRSSPPPTTTPCARERSISAPAAALRSMSSCTFAERALGTTTRPTTPAGAITAMSRCSRRATPCRSSPSGNRASPPAPMISAAVVFSVSCSRSSSSRSRPRVRSASARCSCSAICVAASCRFSSSFSRLDVPQADVAAPHAADARDAAREPALHFGEHPEGHRLEHRHAGLRIHLRGDQQDVRQHHAEEQVAGALTDVQKCHRVARPEAATYGSSGRGFSGA